MVLHIGDKINPADIFTKKDRAGSYYIHVKDTIMSDAHQDTQFYDARRVTTMVILSTSASSPEILLTMPLEH
eukprot:2396096-Ditylum_brightwellii.AAC.1